MIFELARASDWDDILRISVQIHDLHAAWRPDIYFHSDEPYPKEDFLEDLKEEHVYVARDQDRVLGYAVISVLKKGGPGTVETTQLRVNSICVDEPIRGLGIGKAIISELSELAEEMGCSSLILGVHPENQDAMEFYRACGFGIRTINMEKKL